MERVVTQQYREDAASNPSTYAKVIERLSATARGGGIVYSALYGARWVLDAAMRRMDRTIAGIEQRKCLIEPWTISARRFTASELKGIYNTYDWSQAGEEWTPSAEWKDTVVRELLIPNVRNGGTVVEIGPGGGRWSEHLHRCAARLIVIDVAEQAIALCKERFAGCQNVEYILSDGHSIDLPDRSVDSIWSLETFVHINPMDAKCYFREFSRVLTPGGRAVIHHPGRPLPGNRPRPGGRSDLTDRMVLVFAQENGLKLVAQPTGYVGENDVISIFEKCA